MEAGATNLSGQDSLTSGNIQEGLTPSHLKKAKLMFFYTRYPSSNVLKTFFPDVKVSAHPLQFSDILKTPVILRFCLWKKDASLSLFDVAAQ